MRSIKKLAVLLVKWGSLATLIGIPLMILHGIKYPWYPAQDELEKHNNATVLQIGMNRRSVVSSDSEYYWQQRQYLIVDDNLGSKVLTIQTETGKGTSSTIKNGGLMTMVIIYLCLIAVVFYMWWYKPHNNRLQRDASPRSGSRP